MAHLSRCYSRSEVPQDGIVKLGRRAGVVFLWLQLRHLRGSSILKKWPNLVVSLTVAFISVPSIIVNIAAFIHRKNFWTFIAGVLQLSLVVRYIEAIALWNPRRAFLLAKLRCIETIAEGAPQWCLQAHITLRQWSFQSLTAVSSV